jgi:hypothetical protein
LLLGLLLRLPRGLLRLLRLLLRRPAALAGYPRTRVLARALVVVHLNPPLALPLVEELPLAAPRRPVPYSDSTGGRADLPGPTASGSRPETGEEGP